MIVGFRAFLVARSTFIWSFFVRYSSSLRNLKKPVWAFSANSMIMVMSLFWVCLLRVWESNMPMVFTWCFSLSGGLSVSNCFFISFVVFIFPFLLFILSLF